jgi:hypothetical protein
VTRIVALGDPTLDSTPLATIAAAAAKANSTLERQAVQPA